MIFFPKIYELKNTQCFNATQVEIHITVSSSNSDALAFGSKVNRSRCVSLKQHAFILISHV